MGVTQHEIKLLESVIEKYNSKSVIEFGSQTNYTTSNQKYPPFMSEFYNGHGIHYECIDLAGDNNAYVIDLSKPYEHKYGEWQMQFLGVGYDLVTDFGTSEHCVQMNEYEKVPFHGGYINSIYPKGEIKNIELGYYNCWLNKHNFLKKGGIMINVNPLTGHWPEHGYSYLGENFYDELVKVAGYEIIEQGINCATGNCETGKNVYSVLKKVSDIFPDFETFYKYLPIYKS